MIKFNKLFTYKIISVIVIITFTVTSICYGIDLPKKSYLRKNLDFNNPNASSRYLCTLLAALYHKSILQDKLSPDKAFQILENMVTSSPNIKDSGIKVAKHTNGGGVWVYYDAEKIYIEAEETGEFGPKSENDFINSIDVDNIYRNKVKEPPPHNRLVKVVSKIPLTINELLGWLIGLSVSLIPTFSTLLTLPHEYLHIFFALLSTPRMVFHGLVLAKDADPLGIIGKVFPFIETASREFDIDRQMADFNFSMLSEPVRPLYMSPELADILSSFVPSIFDAVLAFSIMRIGLRAKEGKTRWFFLGIGLMKLVGILLYILRNAINPIHTGDFVVGVFDILYALFGVNFGILDGIKYVSFIPQPWIGFLVLLSGIGTVFLGYVIFKSIDNLINLLRKKTITRATKRTATVNAAIPQSLNKVILFNGKDVNSNMGKFSKIYNVLKEEKYIFIIVASNASQKKTLERALRSFRLIPDSDDLKVRVLKDSPLEDYNAMLKKAEELGDFRVVRGMNIDETCTSLRAALIPDSDDLKVGVLKCAADRTRTSLRAILTSI